MDRESRLRLGLDALAGYDSGADAPVRAEALALERLDTARTAILVEGISDQIALETLAARLGRDLQAEAVVVVPMGGAQAISRYVELLGPLGADIMLTGLCDGAEARFFERALGLDHEFFVCVDDLEDELIRAAGEEAVEAVLDSQGDLGSFRTLQKQREWQGREFEKQMHRWLRAGSRRNLRYARLLTESIPMDSIPTPLINALTATKT